MPDTILEEDTVGSLENQKLPSGQGINPIMKNSLFLKSSLLVLVCDKAGPNCPSLSLLQEEGRRKRNL